MISENYALLMGAMVLFIVLAVLMTATRNVDWYSLAMRRSPDLPIDRTGSS